LSYNLWKLGQFSTHHFTAEKVGGACSHLGAIGPKVSGALASLAPAPLDHACFFNNHLTSVCTAKHYTCSLFKVGVFRRLMSEFVRQWPTALARLLWPEVQG